MWDTVTHAFNPTEKILCTYDAASNNTLEVRSLWYTNTNSYQDYREVVKTFNSFNQVLTATVLDAAGGTFTVDANTQRFLHFYEPYTTGIGYIANSGAASSLSPNPASTDLNILIKWEAAQSFTAALTDMAGRVYSTFSAPLAKEFSTTLSLADMPAGNYLLTIKGSNGGAASQTITVAH